jgi:small subunit ribosomal protein S20
MANIKSQKKRILTNAKDAERNKATKSELKTRVKKVAKATDPDEAAAAFIIAQKKLDKAATKGVIHPNAAARRKSRLAKKVNALG